MIPETIQIDEVYVELPEDLQKLQTEFDIDPFSYPGLLPYFRRHYQRNRSLKTTKYSICNTERTYVLIVVLSATRTLAKLENVKTGKCVSRITKYC